MLLESVKQHLTRQVIVDIDARFVSDNLVHFVEKNFKKFPGKSSFKFNITEPKTNAKISMYTMDSGFEMNDEMAAFLDNNPEMEVQIVTL